MKLRALAIVLVFLFSACGPWKVDPNLVGHWQSDKTALTVRTEPSRMQFEFTKDSAAYHIIIHEDFSLSGTIGAARIKEGSIHCNWVFPTSQTGIAYILKFDLEGPIFEGDPLAEKEVQLWLGPDYEGGEWELRYTKGSAVFPMSFPIMKRQKHTGG